MADETQELPEMEVMTDSPIDTVVQEVAQTQPEEVKATVTHPPHQGLRRLASIKVEIAGKDVTKSIDPYLISVQIILRSRGVDNCTIELDDRDARLPVPPEGAPIQISFGWSHTGPRVPPVPIPTPAGSSAELPFGGSGFELVFKGEVRQIESGFARRGGGRRMWVEGFTAAMTSEIKSVGMQAWGEGEKEDGKEGEGVDVTKVLTDAFKASGISVKVDPELAKIKRSFWFKNESPMQFGERLARELGGMFRITDKIATLTKANVGRNVDGEAMPVIGVFWGVNLISWRIKPWVARAQYAAGKTKWFDILKGEYKDFSMKIPAGPSGSNTAKAVGAIPAAAPNRQVGEQQIGGFSAAAQAGAGTGWVMFNGEPQAKPACILKIEGARPGVDGTYMIEEAEHNYSRRGYITRCDIQHPGAYAKKYGGEADIPETATNKT